MTAFCRYLVLAVAGTVFVYGQAINGSISGLVTDKSGASISEAKITVTDVDRNTVFSTISNETGFYLVSQLPIGKYRLTAEKSGFRTYVMDAFPLAAEQRAAINIGLEVGSTTSEVTVAATPQLLDSVTATLSATVSNNQIVDLPLNNRNIYALTSLVPGVFQTKTT